MKVRGTVAPYGTASKVPEMEAGPVFFTAHGFRCLRDQKLQVHSDTQITRCWDFKSIEQFIRRVVRSFEYHAAPDARLVFKVHLKDRGYNDYTDFAS